VKPNNQRLEGKGVFDLIEEAVHLLRTAPVITLAVYFVGAIPFALGLLFFWADMSRSPFASQHLAAASLGLTLLFFWMKFWQTIFARRLWAQAAGREYSPIAFRAALRIFCTQMVIQATGLILLPLALVPILPFPWAYAFYQNATALDDGEEVHTGKFLKRCGRQAGMWPRQNFLTLGIMLVFGVAVFLNWVTVCLSLPGIFKMLLGVDSSFTQSPWAMLNTTFFAAMLGLSYLCVDPILKTIYALRSFYGELLKSGDDLMAELKPFASRTLTGTVALLIFLAVFSASPVRADSTNTVVHVSKIPPPALDQAINQTIHENKYLWRMPREQVVESDADSGIIARFFNRIASMLRRGMHAIGDFLDKFFRRLFHRNAHADNSSSSGYGWIMSLQVLLYGLVAAVIIALVILLIRFLRGQKIPELVTPEAIQAVPDLTDENVRADELPEDGWAKLARELLARGEFRLAMRALYLSGLAHLASRNLISIARFKSNRDYGRELGRRAHSLPALLASFDENVSEFERVWYGNYEAGPDLVNAFAVNLEKMKSSG